MFKVLNQCSQSLVKLRKGLVRVLIVVTAVTKEFVGVTTHRWSTRWCLATPDV